MKANRTARLCRSMLVIATIVAISPTLAAAQSENANIEPTPWDQEKMTELTGQLHKELKAVRDSFRKDPVFTDPGQMNRRAAMEMRDLLRVLEISAKQLHGRVQKGGNMEDTTPVARKIGSLLRDVDVLSRQMQTSAWLQDAARKTMETLNMIAPYYGVKQLYDIEKMELVPNS